MNSSNNLQGIQGTDDHDKDTGENYRTNNPVSEKANFKEGGKKVM